MNTYSHKSKTKSSVVQKKVSSKSMAFVDNRDHAIIQRKANTTGLPDQLKSGIENLSGIDMSDTRVHYNSSKPAQLNAHAYAQGTDIHLASGQEKHLPHEAWHVVQQKQGRVQPTMQMKGKVSINDDKGLEKEADVMAAKALQKKVIGNHRNPNTILNNRVSTSKTTIVQRFKVPEGLEHLSEEVKQVIGNIKISHATGASQNAELYGSKQWGNDTFWAANRKLDEWNLVKELLSEGTNLKDAIEIGFGINDTTEADAIVYNKDNNAVVAGENKIVSGGFSQIVENINSALSQLTTGKRAHQYNKTHLIARVNIGMNSGALHHLKLMSPSVKKGMQTRWRNRLINAYKEGEKNWSGKCTLRLLIQIPGENIFDLIL